jgi:hypothetical protein
MGRVRLHRFSLEDTRETIKKRKEKKYSRSLSKGKERQSAVLELDFVEEPSRRVRLAAAFSRGKLNRLQPAPRDLAKTGIGQISLSIVTVVLPTTDPCRIVRETGHQWFWR